MKNSKDNNAMESSKLVLNDIEKCHITFLYKLHFFNPDFHNTINGNTNINLKDKILYIINPKLIELMKSLYFYNEIKPLFTKDKKINDIIASFPNDLINKIKNQNHDILKDEKLYNINRLKFADLELYYYTNISLSDDNILSYLKPDKFIYNKLNHSKKIAYEIAHKKLILIYETVIHIGILDYNHIFIPEILVLSSDKKDLTIISKEIKSNSIENFKNQIKIIGNKLGCNIGKYKGVNIVVFLNRNNSLNNSFIENKNSRHYNNMNQKLNNAGNHQKIEISKDYQKNYSKIGEFPNPENSIINLKNGVSYNDIQNESIYKNRIFLYDSNPNKNQQFNQNKLNYQLNNNSLSNQFNTKPNQLQNYQNFNRQEINPNQLNNVKKDNNIQILKKKEQIDNLVYLFIDSKKINFKINLPLINNSELEKYYLINLNWFNNYINNKQINYLFNNNIIISKINFIITNNYNLSNKDIFDKLKSDFSFNQELENLCNKIEINNYPINFPIEPQKGSTAQFNYFYNFILISEETIKQLFNFKQGINPYGCLLGNKIVLIINNNLVEICDFINNNYIPKMILDFYDKNSLKESIKLLKEKNNLMDYIKSYMMFNNDNASPIFNKNNEEIGYAYLFNQQIKDYSSNIINDKLIALVRLYFNYAKIRFSKSLEKNKKYLLINPELVNAYKKHYNYITIENKLNGNNIANQIILNIQQNKINLSNVLNDRQITIIIKNEFLDINKSFLNQNNFKINNISEEPPIEQIQGNNYCYYKNFEVIDADIYQIIFNNDEYTKTGNLRECFFENNYIYFRLPSHFSGNKHLSNIEIGILNQDNSFTANFLMECNSIGSFKQIIENAKQNGGFDKFLNSYQSNIVEQLYDNNGNPIGIIYNLMPKGMLNNMEANNNIKDDFDDNFNDNMNVNNFSQNNMQNWNINNGFNNFNNMSNFNNNMFNNNYLLKTQPLKQVPFKNHNLRKIKEEFKAPPLIGLKNVGATCYMNATLQCLSQIEKLDDYIKYHDRVIFVIETLKNQTCLTKSFKFLIENLWPSTTNSDYINPKYVGSNTTNNYFIPEKFKQKISLMNPLFQGVQANDAKDLVNFIIMTLHEELNKKNKYQHVNNSFNININQTDQNLVWNNFLKDFARDNKSIITDLFCGVTHTVSFCQKCQTYKHDFDEYFFLCFHLEEVRKYKLQLLINQNLMISNPNDMNMNNMMNNNQMFQQNLIKIQLLQNNHANIYDCFEYYQKEEQFIGENAMYCNICKMQCPSMYATYLYTPPHILILVLNRGHGVQFKIKMDFCLELDLSNFIQTRTNNEMIKYDLIGVVTHMGESGASGHFIASCKSPIDGQWYQYNDDLVYRINNFNNEILNYAMPYVLFYQKKT